MPAIQFALEGKLERAAIPILLAPVSRFAREKGFRLHRSPDYAGRDDLLRKLPSLLRRVCQRDPQTHVFVLVDYHPRDRRWSDRGSMREAIQQMVSAELRDRLHVHLAVHEIEAWILASPHGLQHTLGRKRELRWANPEAIDLDRPPKRLIKELFRQYHVRTGYRETIEGVRLLSKLDRRVVCERCSGFKDLIDDLARLLGTDRQRLLE